MIVLEIQDAGNTTTLSHYLNLLDTAGLVAGIEKYAATIIRKRSSSPRFQVHNNALLSAQKNEYFNEIIHKPAEWGHIIESSVGAHLINNSISQDYLVYYWRERNNEVDFILAITFCLYSILRLTSSSLVVEAFITLMTNFPILTTSLFPGILP